LVVKLKGDVTATPIAIRSVSGYAIAPDGTTPLLIGSLDVPLPPTGA
jgi:hypothetical protein